MISYLIIIFILSFYILVFAAIMTGTIKKIVFSEDTAKYKHIQRSWIMILISVLSLLFIANKLYNHHDMYIDLGDEYVYFSIISFLFIVLVLYSFSLSRVLANKTNTAINMNDRCTQRVRKKYCQVTLNLSVIFFVILIVILYFRYKDRDEYNLE